MAFPVADDEGFGQSQIPLPSVPPIKSANYLCFKLSSKQCLNCNLSTKQDSHETKPKARKKTVCGEQGCEVPRKAENLTRFNFSLNTKHC